MGNRLGGGNAAADVDANRIAQDPRRQIFNFRNQSGGKKHALPAFAGAPSDDPPHIGHETHIEHAIGLVQNKKIYFIEGKRSAP